VELAESPGAGSFQRLGEHRGQSAGTSALRGRAMQLPAPLSPRNRDPRHQALCKPRHAGPRPHKSHSF
jgi:hypothetical protein